MKAFFVTVMHCEGGMPPVRLKGLARLSPRGKVELESMRVEQATGDPADPWWPWGAQLQDWQWNRCLALLQRAAERHVEK